MRKPSRDQAIEDKNRLSAENTILMQGLQAAVDGRITWYANHKEKDGGGRYKFGLACLSFRALLFVTFIQDGQNPHTAVYDLEEYVNGPFRLDREGFTCWYKFAYEDIGKAQRFYNEHLEKEKALANHPVS